MNRDVNLFQVLIRFQEPDNCRADFVARLADFTNYDGLVATNNPIDAINVDIRSYDFDHEKVRKDLIIFRERVCFALGTRCNLALNSIVYSSKDVVGCMAKAPIREVSYTIDILK